MYMDVGATGKPRPQQHYGGHWQPDSGRAQSISPQTSMTRDHLVIPRTPNTNSVEAALSDDGQSPFFTTSDSKTNGGHEARSSTAEPTHGWRSPAPTIIPSSPLRSTEKAKSKSSKRAEWMERRIKQRAGTLEKLEALLNSGPGEDEDDGDLDSIAHIDKDLIPKITRLRGDREELIRMCSEAVQELSRKEEQNRALQEMNENQNRMISELQRQMQELREQMARLLVSGYQPPASEGENRRRQGERDINDIDTDQRPPHRTDRFEHEANFDVDIAANGRPAAKRQSNGRDKGRRRFSSDSYDSESSDDDHVHSRDNRRRRQRDGRRRPHSESEEEEAEHIGMGKGTGRNARKKKDHRERYSSEESSRSGSEEDISSTSSSGRRRDRRTSSSRESQRKGRSNRPRSSDEESDDIPFINGRRRESERRERPKKPTTPSRHRHRRRHKHGSGSESDEDSLEHTVSHLSHRCSDLELGKKLLCVKLAATTQRLNNMNLQNKALLNAMYACTAHNAQVKTILSNIDSHHDD